MRSMFSRDGISKLLPISLAALVLLLSALMFAASYVPFDSARQQMDALSSDGSADIFTEDLYGKIQSRLRMAAVVAAAACIIIYAGRKRIKRRVLDLDIKASFAVFGRDIKESIAGRLAREDKAHLAALAAVLVTALAARLWFMFQPIRLDEAATFIYFAKMPLYIGLSNYSYPNNHIFHTLWVHILYVVFGNAPCVIRLPAFIAGFLAVPAAYAVTRMLYNRDAALIAGALTGSSLTLIDYSVNARGYSMVCLGFLILLGIAAYIKKTNNTTAWIVFAIVGALGFHAVPVMLYPFGVVVVWLLLSIIIKDTGADRKGLLINLVIFSAASGILAAALYAPVFAVTGVKSVVGNKFVAPLPWSEFIREFPLSLPEVWREWNEDWPKTVSAVIALAFLISIPAHKKLARHSMPVIAAVILWIAPLVIAQRVAPFIRVWLFLVPLYLGLASAGIVFAIRPLMNRMKKYRNLVVPAGAVVLSCWLAMCVARAHPDRYLDEPDSRIDAEKITFFLDACLEQNDRVIMDGPLEMYMKYYFDAHGVPIKYIAGKSEVCGRLFVLVHRDTQEPVEVAAKAGSVNFEAEEMEPLARFEYTDVYLIDTCK